MNVNIKDIIPHRDPMLLIDEIIEIVPGKSVKAVKSLTGNEDFFKGHFPGNPVMPGVLMIEAMAQAGAVAVLSLPENRGKTGYLAGVDKARFKRVVFPGEMLRLEVQIDKIRGAIGVGAGKAYVGDELAVQAEFMFAIK